LRCKLRWSELASSPTRDTITAWALKASSSVQKVSVADNNPRGAGTHDVVVWGDGGIGSSVCTDDRVQPSTQNTPPYYPSSFTPGLVNTYLQARRGVNSDLRVYPATEDTITMTATITTLPGHRATVEPQILANLEALEKALEIGGLLYRNNVIDALLENTLGTVSVNLVSPASDVQLSPGHVGTLVPALTFLP
jgi:Baseplate J-like protein